MHDGVAVLTDLFLIFLFARLGGELMARLHQPPVIGEILVGVLVGGHALNLVAESEVLIAVAQLGIVFLMFEVGLENRFSDLRRVGGTSAMVAASGVLAPFAAGYLFLHQLGHPSMESLFLGAAMVATSVGVTARVLGDLVMLRERESQVILGAAIIDDVLGLLVLAVVAGAARGELEIEHLSILVAMALFFVVFTATVGTRLMRRHGSLMDKIRLSDGPFAFGVLICLGFSALAGTIGLAAIVGAFLAGMVFAETREQFALEERIKPVTNFLTPYFFVLTGMAVDPAALMRPGVLAVGFGVFAIAVATKLVPCGLAARKLGRRGALIVGIGMVPRAEVGIIVASIGLAAGAIGSDVYGMIVLMSILTTLGVPPALRSLFRPRLPKGRLLEEDPAGGQPFGPPAPERFEESQVEIGHPREESP